MNLDKAHKLYETRKLYNRTFAYNLLITVFVLTYTGQVYHNKPIIIKQQCLIDTVDVKEYAYIEGLNYYYWSLEVIFATTNNGKTIKHNQIIECNTNFNCVISHIDLFAQDNMVDCCLIESDSDYKFLSCYSFGLQYIFPIEVIVIFIILSSIGFQYTIYKLLQSEKLTLSSDRWYTNSILGLSVLYTLWIPIVLYYFPLR